MRNAKPQATALQVVLDCYLWMRYCAMSPFFAEEDGAKAEFEGFEATQQNAVGVPVIRDDREPFIITHSAKVSA